MTCARVPQGLRPFGENYEINMILPRRLPLMLGVLQAVGPVSTDMYLPAFPAIESSFRSASGTAQITLATWFLGLSVGQFVTGALTDRFGRRIPLMLGTLIYALGSAGCALSGSVAILAAFRFLSALGASASMIIPRAVVRDVSEGHDAARMMSQLILVLGAAPILAPSLGGLVLLAATWRDIFWIMTAYGLVGFLIAWRLLPDTLAPERRLPLSAISTILRSARILQERSFTTHTLLLSASSFSLFAYLGGSPVLFIDRFGFSPALYAIQFGAIAATYILCSQLNIYAIRAFGINQTLSVACSIYLVSAIVLGCLASFPGVGPIPFALAIAIALGMTGFIGPIATVGALHRHSQHAGTASALLGTVTFLVGASSGLLVGVLTDGTAKPMAYLMAAGGISLKIADLCRPSDSSVSLRPASRGSP